MQPVSNRSMARLIRPGIAGLASTLAGLWLCAVARHLWNFTPKEGDTND